LYHWFVLPLLTINLGRSIFRLVHDGLSWDGLITLLTVAALVMLAFYARIFALSVQDRVIRLEERTRFEKLLPDDLKPRIGEFTCRQLVALRFASDAELPGLARRVLTDKLTEGKAVKRLVQNWRADRLRA